MAIFMNNGLTIGEQHNPIQNFIPLLNEFHHMFSLSVMYQLVDRMAKSAIFDDNNRLTKLL